STKNSVIFVQPGLKGVCQDSALATENLIVTSTSGERGSALVGVFDGHGLSGHYVSKTARDQLPERLNTAVQHTQNELAHVDGAAARDVWARVFGGVFGDIDEELRKDLFHNRDSGSTAVVALRLGPELIVAHIGDSRCVLARIARGPNGKSDAATMEAVQLTIDHKASNPESSSLVSLPPASPSAPACLPLTAAEKVRVQEAGGKVLNYMNTIDRIFLPGKSEPGLAVARAFGDFELKSHGLICRPDVTVRTLDANDQFIVMGSDGVSGRGEWVVHSFYSLGLAVARAFGDFELKSHGLICRPDVTVRSIDANDQFVVMR
ncbi:unnamed protein product, partial [Closterium sp. NIES-54]